VRAGSVLLAVDKQPVKELSLEEIGQLVQGELGSRVELTVSQPGSGVQKKILLQRERIRPVILNKRILAGQVGYLELKAFPKWVPEELAAALEFLEAQGCQGLILDLRNNPGGYLEAALEIASLFLIEGKPVVQVVGRDRQARVINARGPGQDLPLVILVNKDTASAAEILAGALQDNQAALLVGTTTFGKGAIQTVFPLTNGGALKLTTDYYYTPGGQAIQGTGLKPDIEVDGEQQQLQRAWNILSKQLNLPLPGNLALAGKE
jgi:carboxyl-terminal processing protease